MLFCKVQTILILCPVYRHTVTVVCGQESFCRPQSETAQMGVSVQSPNFMQDRRGGADDFDAQSIGTLSSCPEDLEERLEPLAWVTYACENATWFMAFSLIDSLSARRAGPLSSDQAAAWFLHVYAARAQPNCLHEAFAALPWQVRVAVLESPVLTSMCPLPRRATLHMQGLLARARCEQLPKIMCCASTFSNLYGFVWPRASLKECLLRLGKDVCVQYHCVQTPAACNAHFHACGFVLATWPCTKAYLAGEYVLSCRGVHSSVRVSESTAEWYCGHFWTTLPTAVWMQMAALEEVALCRVVRSQMSPDRCGGSSHAGGADGTVPGLPASGFTVKKWWADLILSGRKTWEIRGEATKKRCRVAVLEKGETSGTATIRGDVDIVDCVLVGHWDGQQWQAPTRQEDYLWSDENKCKHCIQDMETVKYRNAYAWVLQTAKKYEKPVDFQRPRGPVTWVRLDNLKPGEGTSGTPGGRSHRKMTGGKGFVGVLQSSIPLPEEARKWLGQKCHAVETLGDGACGLHAIFGEEGVTGALTCKNARELALQALEAAFGSADPEAARLRSTLWREMACRGMQESDLHPEAKLFWRAFADKFPDAAVMAKQAAAEEADLSVQATSCREALSRACKLFFLQASSSVFEKFCRAIAYWTTEGQEPCFQMQAGQCIVNGTQMQLPEGGPQTKLEAIRHEAEVFDALRVAAVLFADASRVVTVLQELSGEAEHAENVARVLQDYRRVAERTSMEPIDFQQRAVAAYLAAIQQNTYYFSIEELKIISRQLEANILIAKEGSSQALTVEAIVHCHREQDFKTIVLRQAEGPGPVRSHFERLQMLEPESDSESDAEHERKAGGESSRTTPTSGSDRFEADVERILQVFERGQDAVAELAALPHYSPEVDETSFEHLRARLVHLVRAFEMDRLTSEDTVQVQYPLWRTGFYPLAVLFECWSRSTGIPAVFYTDAFASLAGSVLHKEIGADIAGFTTRSRYWCCGTAQPGGGKTPALEPMLRMLRACMNKLPHFAPGSPADAFHMVEPMTHAAAIAKFRDTDGYGLIAAGEGGPMLCPAWPSNGTWTQNTHINLQRLLNAAQGGGVTWETVFDRKDRKAASVEAIGGADKAGQCECTNVTLALFQQLSVFRNWRPICI